MPSWMSPRVLQRQQRSRGHRQTHFMVIGFLIVVPIVQLIVTVVHTYSSSATHFRSQTIVLRHNMIAPMLSDKADALHRKREWIVSRRHNLTDVTEWQPETMPMIRHRGNVTCFRRGTLKFRVSECRCKSDWFGRSCSIPGVVQRSAVPWTADGIRLRNVRRRTIMAFPFSNELELLEMRFNELASIVDVFLILESNYTAYGQAKPLHLLDRLLNDTYSDEVVNKIVYVLLDFFPEAARKDGWIADALIRNYIGTHGLTRISGLQMDDLFLLTDADEIPTSEVVEFLQWHDGYSEPVLIRYQLFVYGFYWQRYNGNTLLYSVVPTAATIGLISHVFRYEIYMMRGYKKFLSEHQLDIKVYHKMSSTHRVNAWTVSGEADDIAGWHCSWCFDAEGVRFKLLSAQNGDFPRWGDYPEKSNITYIKHLIANGMWFDNKSVMERVIITRGPKGLMENVHKYRHLLENVYEQELLPELGKTKNNYTN